MTSAFVYRLDSFNNHGDSLNGFWKKNIKSHIMALLMTGTTGIIPGSIKGIRLGLLYFVSKLLLLLLYLLL